MSTDEGDRPDTPAESVQIDDPEGYVAEQHLQQLTETRANVTKRRYKSREASIVQGLSKKRSTALYATAVENYLLNLLPTYDRENETHNEYWTETRLGEVSITPISGVVEQYHRTTNKYRANGREYEDVRPKERVIEFTGLMEVLNRPIEISANFEGITESHLRGQEGETLTASAVIPREVLDAAVATADNFSQEVGLGLEPKTTDKWDV